MPALPLGARVLDKPHEEFQKNHVCLKTTVQTHLMMLETDYETYAAYIECDVDLGYNYPIVQSSTTDIDPILLARYFAY